jgi:hypothetical protein
MRTRGNNGIIGQAILPGTNGAGIIVSTDAAQASLGGSWPGTTVTNKIYNVGQFISGNVNYYVAVANVVNTNSSYANTFGPAISDGYIVMYGTQFQANTIVIANGNTIPQANITYVSPSRLNVRLPNIANTVVLNIDAYNPVVNTGFAQQVPRYNIELLVVGGGGGGSAFGGGGGGGVVYAPVFTLVSGKNYTVSVGSGGTGSVGYPSPNALSRSGGRGTPSTFSSSSPGPVVVEALGGGGGYGYATPFCTPTNGSNGGSGGGANNSPTSIFGTTTQPTYPQLTQGSSILVSYGNPGGSNGTCNYGGGGGGAGAAGNPGAASPTSGQGGNGIPISITGTAVYYGGGGGAQAPSGYRTGGLGGGGTGNFSSYGANAPALNGSPFGGGTPGLGGGGGANSGAIPPPTGVSTSFFPGGSGGSGVVILKIPTPNFTGPGFAPGATITTPPATPGFTILTYPGPGTYTA